MGVLKLTGLSRQLTLDLIPLFQCFLLPGDDAAVSAVAKHNTPAETSVNCFACRAPWLTCVSCDTTKVDSRASRVSRHYVVALEV